MHGILSCSYCVFHFIAFKHLGMIQKVVFDVSDNSIQVRPRATTEQVKEIALSCFGLEVDPDSLPKELNSYCDRNILLQGISIFFKYNFNLICIEIITSEDLCT